MEPSSIVSTVGLVLNLIGLVFIFGKFSGKLEAKDKSDMERFLELDRKMDSENRRHREEDEKQFMQLYQYSSEFFSRITKAEISLAGHSEMLLAKNASILRIELKMDTIEALLRSRRFEDDK
jgi:hypothetical protein